MVVDPSLKGEACIHPNVREHRPGPQQVNLFKSTPDEDAAIHWIPAIAIRITGTLHPSLSYFFAHTFAHPM